MKHYSNTKEENVSGILNGVINGWNPANDSYTLKKTSALLISKNKKAANKSNMRPVQPG